MNNLLWPFCLSLLFKGYIDQCFTDCDLQSVVGCLFKLLLLSLCTVFCTCFTLLWVYSSLKLLPCFFVWRYFHSWLAVRKVLLQPKLIMQSFIIYWPVVSYLPTSLSSQMFPNELLNTTATRGCGATVLTLSWWVWRILACCRLHRTIHHCLYPLSGSADKTGGCGPLPHTVDAYHPL